MTDTADDGGPHSATGPFKVEIDGRSDVFTHDANTAIDVAHIFGDAYIKASAWEKDRSGWQKIYPVHPPIISTLTK